MSSHDEDPYAYRSKGTNQVLGAVAPIQPRAPGYSEGVTAEKFAQLTVLSQELTQAFMKARLEFLERHPNLSDADKTYVIFDASAAIIADWGTSTEHIGQSLMDLPSAIMCSIEMIQHNFNEKQKDMYDKIGGWAH